MKRLDFYKIFTMLMTFILQVLVLTVAYHMDDRIVPLFVIVLFMEFVRFQLTLHNIESIEKTGEVKPALEITNYILLGLNSFLLLIAVIVVIVSHFLG